MRLSSKRKLCELKRMTIFREARSALMWLIARSDRERGQSLTEYILILAVVAVATVAVLGMVSPAVSGQMDSVTTALGGEDEKSAFRSQPRCHYGSSSGCWSLGPLVYTS